MNIQDEMDRIFKMQKDNLANERKFIQSCKNGVFLKLLTKIS
jgi:hypothetical protein